MSWHLSNPLPCSVKTSRSLHFLPSRESISPRKGLLFDCTCMYFKAELVLSVSKMRKKRIIQVTRCFKGENSRLRAHFQFYYISYHFQGHEMSFSFFIINLRTLSLSIIRVSLLCWMKYLMQKARVPNRKEVPRKSGNRKLECSFWTR